MMCFGVRATRLVALLLPFLVVGGPSYALDYPTRPVRFIVSFAAGGPNDTIARILGQYLSEQLGQQFIIEDHVGAGGNIGMQDVLTSAPDGYTIGFVAPNNAINATLYEHIPFDFVRDSTPIAGTMKLANVHGRESRFSAQDGRLSSSPAKAQPGKINFGSGGVGTSPHMSGELLTSMTGIKLTHVSYRGTAPAMTDLLGGQIPVMFDNLPGSIQQIKAGRSPRARRHHEGTRGIAARRADDRRNRARLRSLGVVRHQRAERHAGRNRRQAQRRRQRGVGQSEAEGRFHELGGEVMPMSPAEFGKLVADETAKWAKVVKSAGLKVE